MHDPKLTILSLANASRRHRILAGTMQALVYYISLPFIYLLSVLPFWMLYRLSDLAFIYVYHIISYRREVVSTNLQNSFPEKSPKELKALEKRFYRYFCDLFVETIKTLTISPSVARKRVAIKNIKVLQEHYDKKQSVLLVIGHLGNWELAGARFATDPLHQLFVIYHPLRNKYFERLLVHMRTRLGNGLYPMRETFQRMEADRDKVTATAFIADQAPASDNLMWLKFLNQDTAFFTGIGRAAIKMQYPVVYGSVSRPRRGYYGITTTNLVLNPQQMSPEEIVSLFAQQLEHDIRQSPEHWLWTHRRWKHVK